MPASEKKSLCDDFLSNPVKLRFFTLRVSGVTPQLTPPHPLGCDGAGCFVDNLSESMGLVDDSTPRYRQSDSRLADLLGGSRFKVAVDQHQICGHPHS